MAPLHLPVFVLAPDGALPLEPSGWDELAALQRHSMDGGQRLRMFRVPGGWEGPLDQLIDTGIGGDRPFCDALVPAFPVDSLSLGVYEAEGELPAVEPEQPLEGMRLEALRCLDRIPLKDIQNEACWFYPTEDGSYLCQATAMSVALTPGSLPDAAPTTSPLGYRRDRLRLLWSLMADDEHLTCVGLTYNHLRIDWPVEQETPRSSPTWTWFEIDSSMERPYRQMGQHLAQPSRP